jgi:DNA-binding transcriptional MerR regulator
MLGEGVSSGVAAQVAGISLASVNQLTTAGVLIPSTVTYGRGSSRKYSFSDVVALRFLAVTRPFGVSPALVRPVVQELQRMELDPQKTTGTVVVMNAKGVTVSQAERLDVAELMKSAASLVIGIDRLVEDVAVAGLTVAWLREGPVRGRGRPPKKKLEPEAEGVTHEHEDRDGRTKMKKKSNAKGGLT